MFQIHAIILRNLHDPSTVIQFTGTCCHKIASCGLRGIEHLYLLISTANACSFLLFSDCHAPKDQDNQIIKATSYKFSKPVKLLD